MSAERAGVASIMRANHQMVHIKRVYEKPSRRDGLRILVDRLWPRGLSKERTAVELVAEGRGS